MEKKITIGNVCFLRDPKAEKVLLLHRNREPMQYMSTGVGGKTEFSEDIHHSCHREVFEETGLKPSNVSLKGVVKTLVQGGTSSWILFVYTGEVPLEEPKECNEGTLEWVSIQDLPSRPIIGFIRRLLPHVLGPSSFFEGTIVHDLQGNVVTDTLTVQSRNEVFV